jgi:hypothetical protein
MRSALKRAIISRLALAGFDGAMWSAQERACAAPYAPASGRGRDRRASAANGLRTIRAAAWPVPEFQRQCRRKDRKEEPYGARPEAARKPFSKRSRIDSGLSFCAKRRAIQTRQGVIFFQGTLHPAADAARVLVAADAAPHTCHGARLMRSTPLAMLAREERAARGSAPASRVSCGQGLTAPLSVAS